MRPLLTLLLCGAIAAPGAVLAQELSPPDPSETPPVPVLAPLPTLAPTVETPTPQVASPPPKVEGVAPPVLAPPTDSAPVLMEAKQKANVGQKAGAVAVGVAAGVAGAAVAGPVGKFAGGFVGKRVGKGVFGDGKKDIPQVTEPVPAPVAQAADKVAQPANAEIATAPPLKEAVATPPKRAR